VDSSSDSEQDFDRFERLRRPPSSVEKERRQRAAAERTERQRRTASRSVWRSRRDFFRTDADTAALEAQVAIQDDEAAMGGSRYEGSGFCKGEDPATHVARGKRQVGSGARRALSDVGVGGCWH